MSILIVDDSNTSLLCIRDTLKKAGYTDLLTARSYTEAFNLLAKYNYVKSRMPVNLILLDIMMPSTDGMEVLEKIKDIKSLSDIPVIIVTTCTGEETLKKAFKLGAIDYITKPFSKTELLARIRSVLNLKEEMKRGKELTKKLEAANRKLKHMVLVDGITGVSNRRHFNEVIKKEWKRAQRDTSYLSVIIADIDNFKEYNDAFGHLAGDDCLRCVARTIENILKRPADMIARYGGEEFVLLLPNTKEQAAKEIAEKARAAVESLNIINEKSNSGKYLTISLGVATTIPRALMTHKDLMKDADDALYTAKNEGKNRVVQSEEIFNISYG